MALTRLNVNTAFSATLPVSKGGTGVTTADEIGNLVLLSSASGYDQSSLADIEISLPETYRSHIIYGYFKPETDTVSLDCQLSTDGGSSYHSASNNYTHLQNYAYNNGGNDPRGTDTGDTKLQIGYNVGNNTANGEGIRFKLHHLPIETESDNNSINCLHYTTTRKEDDNSTVSGAGTGTLEATYTAKTNYIKIYFSSGNIEDYFYEVYGVKG